MKNISTHIYIGEDEKLLKSEIKKLENRLSDGYEHEFYFTDDTDFADIISLAENLALFGDKKVIKVYGFEKYAKKFVQYLEQSDPPNVLILVSFNNPKERNSVFDKVKSVSSKPYVKVNAFTKSKAPGKKLIAELESNGVMLNDQAKHFIIDNFSTEGDIHDMCNLISSMPGAKTKGIGVDDIYLHFEGEGNFFKFIDTVFSRNYYETLIEFNKLMQNGENLIGLLIQMHSRLKNLWKARYLGGQNLDRQQIKKEMGEYREWMLNKYFNQCNNYTFPEMSNLITELHKMDVNVKSADKSLHKTLFEIMLLKFS